MLTFQSCLSNLLHVTVHVVPKYQFTVEGMAIYICPSDEKYSCSWEGAAEDVIFHFEQEHDDLLHYNNTFDVDLLISSENRLFVIDEEVYLTQTRVYEKVLVIKLRYLGPQRLAKEICYSVLVKADDDLCEPQCMVITTEGIEIDLDKLESLYPQLQHLSCTLNVTKNFSNIDDYDDNTFIEDLRDLETSTTTTTVTDGDASSHVSVEVTNEIESDHEDSADARPSIVTVSRSKTTNFDENKKVNIKRNKSTLSLGPISEYESSITCFECRGILKPPIFICPCDQNFCAKCQNSICRLCQEKVTYERNLELEEKYNKVLHPCKYKKLGCPQKLFYNDLTQHEINCSFCEYKCPMDECHFEGQYKGLCKHLKLIHGSTKMLESCIIVFQNVPEAFLVNEEKGIFYCYVRYHTSSVLWEAKFCGPKERNFFCELKFKDGKLKQPVLLKKIDNVYSVEMSHDDLKRLKLKSKNAILTITG